MTDLLSELSSLKFDSSEPTDDDVIECNTKIAEAIAADLINKVKDGHTEDEIYNYAMENYKQFVYENPMVVRHILTVGGFYPVAYKKYLKKLKIMLQNVKEPDDYLKMKVGYIVEVAKFNKKRFGMHSISIPELELKLVNELKRINEECIEMDKELTMKNNAKKLHDLINERTTS